MLSLTWLQWYLSEQMVIVRTSVNHLQRGGKPGGQAAICHTFYHVTGHYTGRPCRYNMCHACAWVKGTAYLDSRYKPHTWSSV